MPRNASGTYSLPSGNPVSSGTLIDANWANNTLNDLANEVTDSLSRSAEGGMLAPLRLTDGVQATPSLAFTNEPSSGLYRAGTNDAWFVSGGNQVMQFTSSGVVGRLAAGAVGTPSLTFFGDLNTGLWSPAADTVALSTGGVERLRVGSGGDIAFDTNVLFVDATNNRVGVGTATPGYTLDVNGTIQAVNGLRSGTSSATVVLRAVGDSASAGVNLSSLTVGRDTTAGSSWIQSFGAAAAETLQLNPLGGNVGIGTTSPQHRLDVAYDANATSAVRVSNSNLGTSATATLRLETQGGTWTINSNRNGGSLSFSDGGGERARFDNAGNLGIGTSVPAYRLDLQGASGVGMQIYETSTGNNNRLIITQVGTVTTYNSTFSIGSANHAWQIANVERMRLDASGNLGIGTSGTITNRLQVECASGADRDIFLAGVTGASNGLYVQWNHATAKTHVRIADIPTSSAGLPAGTLWNDSGTLKIA